MVPKIRLFIRNTKDFRPFFREVKHGEKRILATARFIEIGSFIFVVMLLKKISLTQYKNQTALQLAFDAKINCFIGHNGKGKTNILDAIYHLSLGKSYFNPITTQNVQFGQDFFILEGVFEKNQREEKINCSFKKGQKKVLKRNGKTYEKIAEHIGLIPLVMISPADRDLIVEGSSTRRKFIDGVIGQTDGQYLNLLLEYLKVVAQRNALLKYFALNRTFDATALEVYDGQLDRLGTPIFEKRKAFLTQFMPIVQERYAQISQARETASIVYESPLHEKDFPNLLATALKKDRAVQFSTVGVHKDDLGFTLDDMPLKTYGSQGQQKSFLIALKLAQFDYLREKHGLPPLVLLDDIFDKLDQTRVTEIIRLLSQEDFGQLFISDTHEDRTLEALKASGSSYQLFNLNQPI